MADVAEIQKKELTSRGWLPWAKTLKWALLEVVLIIAALLETVVIPDQQLVDVKPYQVALLLYLVFRLARLGASVKNKALEEKVRHDANLYCAVVGILIFQDILTVRLNLLPLPFFPSVAQIFQVMVEDAGTLLISTGYSMRLLVIGFTIGTVLGIVSGVLIGWYRKWNYWLFPVIKVMGVIPATAWIPIAMIVFPSSFYAGILLIVLCVWFPVAYMTSGGIESVENAYFEAARTLGADEKFLIFNVAIPGAMPSIFTGIYTATGTSFATLVVSEMIGAKAGLGWYINWAKGWSNYAKVYASIIIMAVVFSIVMGLIFKIRDKALIWQRGLLK